MNLDGAVWNGFPEASNYSKIPYGVPFRELVNTFATRNGSGRLFSADSVYGNYSGLALRFFYGQVGREVKKSILASKVDLNLQSLNSTTK